MSPLQCSGKTLFYLLKLMTNYFYKISYAIGIAEPLSVTIFTYGTSTKSSKELHEIVKNNFDLRPGKIIR